MASVSIGDTHGREVEADGGGGSELCLLGWVLILCCCHGRSVSLLFVWILPSLFSLALASLYFQG